MACHFRSGHVILCFCKRDNSLQSPGPKVIFVCNFNDLARVLEATICSWIPLLKTSISEPWPPDPDFQNLARALEAIIFLLTSLLKTSISEPWPPDPDFLDLARALEATICSLIPLLKTSISKPWPPDPDFQDWARALEATTSLLMLLLKKVPLPWPCHLINYNIWQLNLINHAYT